MFIDDALLCCTHTLHLRPSSFSLVCWTAKQHNGGHPHLRGSGVRENVKDQCDAQRSLGLLFESTSAFLIGDAGVRKPVPKKTNQKESNLKGDDCVRVFGLFTETFTSTPALPESAQ